VVRRLLHASPGGKFITSPQAKQCQAGRRF
jgi:hypothetical protein